MAYNTDLLKRVFDTEPATFFVGPPACGKGTQAMLLVDVYKKVTGLQDIFYSDSGDRFRERIPKMSERNQKRIADIQASGTLQSWLLASAFWTQKFLDEWEQGPIIFDGGPRRKEEADAFLELCRQVSPRKMIAFHLNLSDNEMDIRMIKRNEELRLKGKSPRSDSATPEGRKKRISEYYEETIPAIKHFGSETDVIVYEIDGMQSIDSVHIQIVLSLENYALR